MAENNIKKLEELTKKLPSLDRLVRSTSKNVNIIEAGSRDVIMKGLLKNKSIAVANAWLPENSKIETHVHEHEIEWLIVYKGIMEIKIKNDYLVVNAGDSIRIEPNDPHSALFKKETLMIAITLPPAKGYPDDRQ